MKKFLMTTLVILALGSTNSVFSFVFVDPSAITQRAAEFVKTTKNRADQITHFAKVVEHAKNFNDMRKEVERYQNQMERMYKNISRSNYYIAFNISDWNWTRLDEYIIKAHRSWNRAWYDTQMNVLRSGNLYLENPYYRGYVDQMDELNKEIGMIEETQYKFDNDLHEEYAKLDERINALRKEAENITTGTGIYASGQSQELAMQALLANLQLAIHERQQLDNKRDTAEKEFQKQKEGIAQRGRQVQAKSVTDAKVEDGNVIDELLGFDEWASRIKENARSANSVMP